MEIDLKATLRHKGKSSREEENHSATFGMYNEWGRNGTLLYYVTIGIRDGDKMVSIDLPWSELQSVIGVLDASRIRD